MDTPRSVYPLPEALPGDQGTGWRIRDGRRGRGVNFDEKIIHVPLDDSAVSHCARMQEIGRIKWDDPTVVVPTVLETSLLYKAVEDHRINYLLHRAGVDLSAGPFTEEQLDLLDGLPGAAGTLTALLLTDYTDHGPTAEFLAEHVRPQVAQVFTEVRRRVRASPTKAGAVAVARWLRTVVSDIRLVPSKKCKPLFCLLAGGAPCSPGREGSYEDFFDLGWNELEEDGRLHEVPAAVRDQLPRELSGRVAEAARTPPGRKCHLVPWGDLGLEAPPRTQGVLGKFLKKWNATEEGVFPRYAHRYFVDGRVFARRCKVPGGTVVIDASGSMSLTGKQIQSMVECAPGCLVACYSGTGKGGVLRILAANGKRVDNKFCAAPKGYGNIVDFPALAWAYKHGHPRIWVSDQVVTGVGDVPGDGNLAMCAAAVKKGRFFTAHNTGEALAVLKRLGRYYRRG